jgi:hypothetical protein
MQTELEHHWSIPSKALIAYCVLADRLRQGGSLFSAIVPFLAPVCAKFSGELFDAQKFAEGMSVLYGIKMPRLAALGLTEQLEKEGFLVRLERTALVYRYTNKATEIVSTPSNQLTENQINVTVEKFVEFVRSDSVVGSLDRAVLENALYLRLLNVDSMRILSRADVRTTLKRTANTLQRPEQIAQSEDVRRELHLDFLVSEYLVQLQQSDTVAFELLSDVAFANMAAEAITCFVEPPDLARPLSTLTVYLDSPLILDMLGVNEEYKGYGAELLALLIQSKARVAVLDHCVSEAESIVAARLAHARSGFESLTADWGVSFKPDLLAALKGQIANSVIKLGIQVERDPEQLTQAKFAKALGNLQSSITERMSAWKNTEAKSYDERSILSMVSMRPTSVPATHLYDANAVMLTRNTPLVSIANQGWTNWLKDTTSFSHSVIETWAPIAMTDKQFAGYVWMRTGGGEEKLPRARLMAHCAAAIRPRADIKAKTYNLVVSTFGKSEADTLVGLVTDRDGERALMLATSGDPEDITQERLPFILNQVKLAAGAFAALEERKKADAQLAAQEKLAQEQIEKLAAEKRAAELHSEAEIRKAKEAAEKIDAELNKTKMQAGADADRAAQEVEALKSELNSKINAEKLRIQSIYRAGLDAGCREYRSGRWLIAIGYAVVSWSLAVLAAGEFTWIASLALFIVPLLGFWFVPEVFEGPARSLALKRLRAVISRRDPDLSIPPDPPDFKERRWVAIEM